jgi:1-acyl-sn-glycerol-3-phosphate acyltransferase
MAEEGLALNAKRLIRVIVYTTSMYVLTHVAAFLLLPVGLVLVTLDRESVPRLKKRFVEWLFWVVGKRITVRSLENVEEGRSYVVVSNYPSFYAGFALMSVFPEASIVAKAFISRIPILGHFMKRIGTIFVDPGRGRGSRQAIDMGLHGEAGLTSVIIFPEGERTADGHIHEFKRGFIYILRQSPLDLLPVTLNGFYQLKPVKRMTLDPDAQPEVIIHRPIRHAQATQMSDHELMEATVGIIGEQYRP